MKLTKLIIILFLVCGAWAQTYTHPVFGYTPLDTWGNLGGDSLFLNVSRADTVLIWSSGDSIHIEGDSAGTIIFGEIAEFEKVVAETLTATVFDTLAAYNDVDSATYADTAVYASDVDTTGTAIAAALASRDSIAIDVEALLGLYKGVDTLSGINRRHAFSVPGLTANDVLTWSWAGDTFFTNVLEKRPLLELKADSFSITAAAGNDDSLKMASQIIHWISISQD